MFLSNLSTSTERQARKSKAKAKHESDDGDKAVDPSLRRGTPEQSKILYTSEAGTIPRDVLLNFLQTCMKMLEVESNISEMIHDCSENGVGLHMAAVDFQRDVLEYNFGIERNFGCKYLSMLSVNHPDDQELLDAAKDFMFSCLKNFIGALKLRAKMYKKGQLEKPRENESMSRNSILEFFEACCALMALPETKEELRSIFISSKKVPNERVIEMQRNVIKLLGYNPDFGVQCLSRITTDFPNDRDVAMRMQYFATSAELACREATFSDKEKEEFYSSIPPLMHHFPHMFIVQQRLMAQSQMHGMPVDPAAKAKEIETLKKSGILTLMTSAEGRTKLQEFALRVQASKDRVQTEVSSWDLERKVSYFDSFSEHPLIHSLQSAGDDPMTKMQAFLTMNEGDLDEAMKLISILSDDSEVIQSKLKENSEILQTLHMTLGSMANLKPRPMPQQTHDHSHGHSHDHNGNCQSHTQPKQDVSSGKADTMER